HLRLSEQRPPIRRSKVNLLFTLEVDFSMKARVLVAVVGIPFLLFVLAWAPDWATMVLLALMCAIGAMELMHAVVLHEGGRQLLPLTMLMAALVPIGIYLSEKRI